MKVKTAELSGRALDWAVAMAIGMITGKTGGVYTMHTLPDGEDLRPVFIDTEEVYSPSENWTLCGPLIEKFKVCIDWNTCNIDSKYDSEPWMSEAIGSEETCYGETPQIAICRAVVASKLGDEVDIPDELMESK